MSCKISDKAVENRILEAIPNQLADQTCVGLQGAETKAELLAKIKDTIVRNRKEVYFCTELICIELSRTVVRRQSGTWQEYAKLCHRVVYTLTVGLQTIWQT